MGYSKIVVVDKPGELPSNTGSVNKLKDFLDPLIKEMGLSAEFTTTPPFCASLNSDIDITLLTYNNNSTRFYLGNKLAHDNECWAVSSSYYGFDIDTRASITTCHAVLSKHKNILSVGVSGTDTDPPYLTETIVKYGDGNIFAIQHGVYIPGNDGYTDYRDVYTKSLTDFKSTEPQLSLWYRSDNFVAMVPAINPWTNETIPDLYLSTIRPAHPNSLRQIITVGNRKFISGLLSDGSSGFDNAPLTFIEI